MLDSPSQRAYYAVMTSNRHTCPLPLSTQNRGAMQMFFRTHFFRWIAIPACVIAGVLELAALQRSKLLSRKSGVRA